MTPRLLTLVVLLTAGCRSGGDVSLFGYSSAPPFDPDIKTVYVPVFKSVAFQTMPNRELEVDITQAVIREINGRSTMRVVSDRDKADTELLGTLVQVQKNVHNRNQQNHVREAEVILTCNVVWQDLRDGRVLSNPRPLPANVAPPPAPFDPSAPPVPPTRVKEPVTPVTVQAIGRLIPELGETNATANTLAVNQLARQIVNMMESPW